MLLLELNPLSRSVAISELLLLLAFATFLGWILAKVIIRGRINALKGATKQKRLELEECNRQVTHFVTTQSDGVVEDDLKLIEGIGPKIELLLKNNGIATFSQLASASHETLAKILYEAGPRFQMHDPGTWSEQANLALNENWKELEELQNRLTGGREL